MKYIKKNKTYNLNYYINALIVSPIFFLFLINLSKYTYIFGTYTLFNILSFGIFFKIISKNSFFFERFLSFYLFMGFFVKFHFFSFYVPHYFLTLGINNVTQLGLEETLNVSIFAFLSFLLVSHFLKKFFFNSRLKSQVLDLSKFQGCIHIFSKHLRKIYFLYFIFAFFFIAANLKYNIYSKGNISNTPEIITSIFSYFLTVGLPFIFLSLLHFDLVRKKSVSAILIFYNILESFFISLSIVSRNLILNLSVFFVGFYSVYSNKDYKRKIYSKLAFIMLALFLVTSIAMSIFLVDRKRNLDFSNVSIIKETRNITTPKIPEVFFSSLTSILLNSKIRALLVDRWVGLEYVASVVSYPNKNFGLLYMALKEVKIKELSFFDKNFIDSPYKFIDFTKKNFITTPGFIAFLYYPGSYLFLVVAVSFFIFIGFFMEYLAFKLSFRNEMLAAFISNLVAYRFISFGYTPINSIIFFIIILLSLFGYYGFLKMAERALKYNV